MSRSFGAAASLYESARPSYPQEAVRWMLEPAKKMRETLRVADVGAGTGKLTRVILSLGADVIAIEPDEKMLAVLREELPEAATHVGSAERLPIGDASVDAVVLGQAWHWVNPEIASLEIARVLSPGGVLGLVWNIRDESIPWVHRLTQIVHGSKAEEMLAEGNPFVATPFGNLEKFEWRWSRAMTRKQLVDMVQSRSYVLTAPADERARIGRELSSLFDDLKLTGETTIDLPYVTKAYRARVV